jgi:hypothetical protein
MTDLNVKASLHLLVEGCLPTQRDSFGAYAVSRKLQALEKLTPPHLEASK